MYVLEQQNGEMRRMWIVMASNSDCSIQFILTLTAVSPTGVVCYRGAQLGVFSDLKEVIQSKARHGIGTLKDVGPHTLDLWKPKGRIAAKPEMTLAARIGSLEGGLSEYAIILEPTDSVFDIFQCRFPNTKSTSL
ncbi:hypothetical protein F5887DRAFT_918228 [Amanita rubescens]|nr:hypothetical protein F5887DRAFT_918228 [Amanita rubescens]